VAVPTTHLTAADSRTRANHSYKFRTISCNSTTYKYSLFPRTIPSWNLLPAETAEAMYVRRCTPASSFVVPPFISIGVIFLPEVCRLLSRSRARSMYVTELDMDWIHPWIELDWVGLEGTTVIQFLNYR